MVSARPWLMGDRSRGNIYAPVARAMSFLANRELASQQHARTHTWPLLLLTCLQCLPGCTARCPAQQPHVARVMPSNSAPGFLQNVYTGNPANVDQELVDMIYSASCELTKM